MSLSNGLEHRPKLRFKGHDGPWTEKKICDIFQITRGYVLSANNVFSEPTEEYKYCVFSSQTKDNGLMGYYNDYLYENAITWTTDGANAGTVHFREGKFYCTNVCGVLFDEYGNANRCTAEILGNKAKKYVSYVGNPKLMNNVMADIKIFIPSKEEQYKIDAFIKILDEKIAKQQQLVELLKKYKRGMIESTLSKEVTTSYNLSDIAKIYDGTHQTPIYVTNGIKFVSVENINNLLQTEKYISHQSFIKEFKIRPEKGDVLMTRIGDIGTASYIDFDDPVAFYVSLALFKCTNLVNGKFLSYYICSNQFQKELWKRTLHIAFPKKINTGEIGSCIINLPNIDKQIEISSVLDKISKKIGFEETKLNRIIDIKKGLLQQLFI